MSQIGGTSRLLASQRSRQRGARTAHRARVFLLLAAPFDFSVFPTSTFLPIFPTQTKSFLERFCFYFSILLSFE